MVTNLKVCKSIMRKNKSFTIGLFIMSILTIAIGFLGFNIGDTSKNSLTDFIDSTNLPDTLYTTNLIPTATLDSLKTDKGVKSIESRFVYDSKFELSNNKSFPARIFTYNQNGTYQISISDEIKTNSNAINTYIPVKFAREHNILPGDKVEINSPFGMIDAVVKGLAASAEGFFPSKDFMSNQEGYSYCYIYIDQSDFNKFFDTTKFSNQFLLYFENNISQSLKDEIFKKIDNIFKNDLLSKKTFDKSKKNLLSFSDDIDSIDILTRFISILVLFITLGFNFIFIQIIVKKERKTIGLLRALGYSKTKVVMLFCLFTFLINFSSTIIGLPLGYGLLKLAAYAMSYNQGVAYSIISISPLITTLIVILSFLCGIISAILSASAISKIDPSESYGKQIEFNNEPIKIMHKFKGNEFVKISFASILRNIRRQIVAALSVTACITFMFIGLEGFGTTSNITESVYGKRLLYDIAIRNIEEDGYNKISNIEGVEILEPNIYFEASFNNNYLVINALKEDYQLVKLYDKNNSIIQPKNGIIIDEITANNNNLEIGDFIEIDDFSLQIDGIAREILAPVSYISIATAQKMGIDSINGAMIKAKDPAQIERIFNEIFDMDSSYYLIRNSDQHKYIRDLYLQIQLCLFILSVLAIAIGTLLIGNMSIVDFLEMKNKYATLRALGYNSKQLTKINLFQNMFRVLIGGILALPISFIVGNLFTNALTTNGIQFIFVGFFPFFGISAAISLIYVLIGVIISYFYIKKLNLVEQLNNNE